MGSLTELEEAMNVGCLIILMGSLLGVCFFKTMKELESHVHKTIKTNHLVISMSAFIHLLNKSF